MQFIAPVTVEEAANILWSHQQEIPILADTVVEAITTDQGTQGAFSVKRQWKGRFGIKYLMVELNGTLAAASDQQTAVTASVRLGAMAYVTFAFALIVFLLTANLPYNKEIGWAVVIFFPALFLFDAFVLIRIVDGLQKGRRRK